MRICPLEIQRVYFFRIKYIAYNRKKSFNERRTEMEMNYIIVVDKNDNRTEGFMESFEILERFLKVERTKGTFIYINIDEIKTFCVAHKD